MSKSTIGGLTAEHIEVLRIEIAKLELKKGDVLLLKFPTPLTMAQQRNVASGVRQALGPSFPFVVVPHDVEIQIAQSPPPTCTVEEAIKRGLIEPGESGVEEARSKLAIQAAGANYNQPGY